MNTWKGVERRIASLFGTRRTPLSGGNSLHTRSDTLHPKYFIEVKHGASTELSFKKISELFAEVRERAEKEGKIPMLALHGKGRRDTLIWLELRDLNTLIDGGLLVGVEAGELAKRIGGEKT